MRRVFTSPEARSLSFTFSAVRTKLGEKYLNSDANTRAVLDATILQYIGELDALLRSPNVRGHLDPTMRTPDVSQDSATGILLKRLGRKIKAVRVLLDVVHLDPPANPNEVSVISKAHQVLNLLYGTIIPPSSSSGSECQTDSE